MKQSSSTRWAVGTLAAVAIALSIDWLWQRRSDHEEARTAQIAIQGQLEAFRRGDYRAAYRYAAPEIQARFPLRAFREMVERGYPQIARSRSAAFGSPEVHGGMVAMPVTVTGQDGVVVRVVYFMRREGEGWRVAGVDDGSVTGGPPRPDGRPAPEQDPKSPAAPEAEKQKDLRDAI